LRYTREEKSCEFQVSNKAKFREPEEFVPFSGSVLPIQFDSCQDKVCFSFAQFEAQNIAHGVREAQNGKVGNASYDTS
jgi:hypothetical protein